MAAVVCVAAVTTASVLCPFSQEVPECAVRISTAHVITQKVHYMLVSVLPSSAFTTTGYLLHL